MILKNEQTNQITHRDTKSFHPETEGCAPSVSFFTVNTLTMQRSKEYEAKTKL